MKIGLETESYHLQFITGKMDVFGFIQKTAELGLEGVMLNIIPWPGREHIKVLESFDTGYLAKVKEEIQKYNLFAEIDTCGTDVEHLTNIVKVAHQIGADVIRTYIPFDEFDSAVFPQVVADLKELVPVLKKYRVKIALENHEFETSNEIIGMIEEIDSIWVKAHCDIGNGMMAWEDPVEAVRNLAPYAYTTHFKDHIIVEDGDDYRVCGVPIGTGNIDLDECFKILVEESSLARINIEMCFPYCTKFRRTPGAGGIDKIGEGAFKVEQPPYDYDVIKPLDYYYPPAELLDQMIEDQAKGVEQCAKYTLALRDKYCR